LEKLSNYSPEISNIISRLMKGSLYGCFALYKTTKIDKLSTLADFSDRNKIESGINELIEPAIIAHTPNFTEKEQKVIKGIKGISYDSKTFSLKLTYETKKQIIDKLTANELKRHKKHINKMYTQVQAKLSKFGLRQATFGIHTISDVNKTNRKVEFRLTNNDIITIGHSSHCLYIAVFIKNIPFANFNPSHNTMLGKTYTQNVKMAIKNYLKKCLQVPDLEELELYSEVENG
jgi:hypothetical protein